MLTDIPRAERYFINPLKSINSLETRMFSYESLLDVGGVGMMNEVGVYLGDENIVLVMGVSEDKCLLFVDLTDLECIDILNKAKLAYDIKAGRIIKGPQVDEVKTIAD